MKRTVSVAGTNRFAKFLAVLLFAFPSFSFSAAPVEKEKIALNFVNTDIESVVKAVSIISGRNFVLDPRVKGTINVVSSSPIAPELAYPILISALRLQGFTVVEGNGTGVTKIIPEADAKTHAIPTTTQSGLGEYRLVTRVFAIRGESAAQLVPILRPLVSASNVINVYPANNTLVVTDYADNIKRLEKVIATIEQGGSDNTAVFRLKHIAASDAASLLFKLFGEGSAANAADPGQRAAIVVDLQSNSVVVRTDTSVVLGRIRSLLNEIDQAPVVSGNIHVITLKNAEAAKLAQTLRAILSGDASASANAGTAGVSGAVGGGAGGAAVVSASGAGGVKGSSIQADATTNSLIIVAPEPVFNNLRRVIDALDRRRAQVFIEALIVEISADRATELGFQWQSFAGAATTAATFFSGTNFATAKAQQIINGTVSAKAGAGLTVGVAKAGSLGVLARFLETEANANILSTPNLITLDNEEGKIVIGQNLPFVTGQYAQTGSSLTPTPFQTIERRDVGLSLKVKPQISEGGTVKVQISQEVSSVNSTTSSLGPVTNKRAIDSTVLVEDGGIIALGGLIEDNYGAGEEKVPVLGDIPLFGALFRYETRKRTKTNLMVFLRPQVLRDEASTENVASQHYGRVQREQSRVAVRDRQMPGEASPPQLPGSAQNVPSSAEAKPVAGPETKAQ
ncbi:type II secretion system secretin GspD [Sulfuritalea sp.]|uniref:type II secretion system secretin GspD n=1 Tax=Sulfuritalea sp. TaxID=2480090 RepID=UPI001AC374F1|nr:type II secretion system secretin GspD [Sulfuritalea sp.]MBN8474437.1 type II secretion system secretin GspD [Sulfuritalea sp.]